MSLSTDDLAYAILSMDSYNRGSGIPNPEFSAPYTVLNIGLPDGHEAAGISATAYQVSGTAVIAFRGPDTPILSWDFLNDVWNGWGVGAGNPAGHRPVCEDHPTRRAHRAVWRTRVTRGHSRSCQLWAGNRVRSNAR